MFVLCPVMNCLFMKCDGFSSLKFTLREGPSSGAYYQSSLGKRLENQHYL
jgi:hypothetical protein